MLVTDALFSLGAYGVPYIKMAGSLLIPAAAVSALYLWRRKPDIRTFFRLERIGLSEDVYKRQGTGRIARTG